MTTYLTEQVDAFKKCITGLLPNHEQITRTTGIGILHGYYNFVYLQLPVVIGIAISKTDSKTKAMLEQYQWMAMENLKYLPDTIARALALLSPHDDMRQDMMIGKGERFNGKIDLFAESKKDEQNVLFLLALFETLQTASAGFFRRLVNHRLGILQAKYFANTELFAGKKDWAQTFIGMIVASSAGQLNIGDVEKYSTDMVSIIESIVVAHSVANA